MKKDNRTAEDRLAAALVPAEEQPYQVPENWAWTYLSKVAALSNGDRGANYPSKKDYVSSGIPFINAGAIQNGVLDTEAFNYITKEKYDSLRAGKTQKNDILYCLRGSLGKTAIVDFVSPAAISSSLCILRPTHEIELKYLYFLLVSDVVTSQQNIAENGSAQPNLSAASVMDYKFPLPPLAEQHRIVERISSLFAELDEAKEEAEAIIDGYEDRKAAILHRAFTGELTEEWRKEREIDINTWQSIRFESVIIAGPQNGLYKSKDYYGHGYRILRVDGFYDGWIEPWNTLKRLSLTQEELDLYSLHIGDIVVNRVNSMPYLGKSALVRDLPEPCVFESNMMRIVVDIEMAVPEYVIKYLNSSIGLLELRKNAKQAINQASINQTDVKNVQISLPTLAEQHEIVRRLDSLLAQEDATKSAAEDTIAQIATLRQSILARAFRGELGTNDESDEPAMELLKRTLEART